MAEIIPMTEEQKFQLEIYKLVRTRTQPQKKHFNSLALTS